MRQMKWEPGFPHVAVHHILGVDREDSDDLVRSCGHLAPLLGLGFLPVADAEGGNPICISLRTEDFGTVWFHDHELDFDEELYAAGAGGNPEWATPIVRLGYGSFITPGTVYDYVVATGELIIPIEPHPLSLMVLRRLFETIARVKRLNPRLTVHGFLPTKVHATSRLAIDMLETLQAKTKGNLTAEESQLLKNTLNELRMGFVQIAESAAGGPQP